MLTLPEAIARFDAASTAGEIPDRRTGGRGPLKPSRRAPIISNVRKAIDHALTSTYRDRAISDWELESTDLTPLLQKLPTHGRLAAQEDGASAKAASKLESNVRLFVSVILGRDVVKDRQPVERTRVLPSYQALFDVLDKYIVADNGKHIDKRRSLRRGFVEWVELAVANGAATPAEVPDDYDTVLAWGARLGWKRKDTVYALNAWRCAVRLAGAPYALAHDVVTRRGIGIKALPDIVVRARTAGFAGSVADATAADLLPFLAPKLGKALDWVIAQGLEAGRSSAWAAGLRDAASWMVAGLITLGEDPWRLTWYDLWTERRPVTIAPVEDQDDQLAQYGLDVGASIEHHSLVHRVLDATARRSYELSPLQLYRAEQADDAIPVYTDSLLANLECVWVITERFFGQRMHAQKPELWAPVRIEYEALQRHTATYNEPRILLGRKAKDRLEITWPQIICMGLPWLARECYALRRQLADRGSRIGHLESRESQQLLSRYCEALTEYAIVALMTDDCLRIKNYAGAMANDHLVVRPITDNGGRWTGVAEIRTNFRMLDGDHVSLKSKKMTGTMYNERLDRRVTPGIVDHVLWHEYWTLARPRALVAAGLIPHMDAFDTSTDRFAVFVTPRPTSDQRTAYQHEMSRQMAAGEAYDEMVLPAWRGNMSEDSLSDAYGFALYRICRDLLKRKLPAWGSPEFAAQLRGLLSGHMNRFFASTYLGGVRGNWAEATYRTNDEEATLKKHYVYLSAWAKEREHLDSPEGLHWFDRVMDRVMMLRSRDDPWWPQFWQVFDPVHPDLALSWLDRAGVSSKVPGQRRSRLNAAA